MATFTLIRPDMFTDGATVAVYPMSNWPHQSGSTPAGAPLGSPTATATVAAGGAATLTGLTAGVLYVAYAQVGSEHRYIAFTVDEPTQSEQRVADLEAHSSGRELGYAEVTTDQYTANPTVADVPGLAVTVTIADRPVIVEVGGPYFMGSVVNDKPFVSIREGSTQLAHIEHTCKIVNEHHPLGAFRRRLALTSGSTHTYKASIGVLSPGTGTCWLAASATSPAWLQVREV